MNFFSFLSSCFSRENEAQDMDIMLNKRTTSIKIERKLQKDDERSTQGSPTSPTSDSRLSQRYKHLYNSNGSFECNSAGLEKLTLQKFLSSESAPNEDGRLTIGEDSDIEAYTHDQWLKILKNNDLENTATTELVYSIRHGIPDELRPQIWDFLANINQLKSTYPKDYYQTLKTTPCRLDSQIRRDVGRTFPSDPYFKAKENNAEEHLFNVLRAYANHDPEVGYTQGMNYIVGKLLIILNPSNYQNSKLDYFQSYKQEFEEKAFWVLIHLAFVKNCRPIYKNEFPKMNSMLSVLDARMKQKAPEVYDLIHKCEFDIFNCFHSMFICLLLDCSPAPIAKRFLDLFLIEGDTVLFKVIIRAVIICKKEIKEASQTAYLHRFLKHDMMQKCYDKCKDNLHYLFPGSESSD